MVTAMYVAPGVVIESSAVRHILCAMTWLRFEMNADELFSIRTQEVREGSVSIPRPGSRKSAPLERSRRAGSPGR
jgi:hypothetical protein